jgi:ankyrin repeat protein
MSHQVNAGSKDGCTPLYAAVFHQQEDAIARLLADERTDVNARIRDGSSPLHCAVFHGFWQVSARR